MLNLFKFVYFHSSLPFLCVGNPICFNLDKLFNLNSLAISLLEFNLSVVLDTKSIKLVVEVLKIINGNIHFWIFLYQKLKIIELN